VDPHWLKCGSGKSCQYGNRFRDFEAIFKLRYRDFGGEELLRN